MTFPISLLIVANISDHRAPDASAAQAKRLFPDRENFL
jgi:hypothetical protein